MTPKQAWSYLRQHLEMDGWGCDGPYYTEKFMAAYTLLEDYFMKRYDNSYTVKKVNVRRRNKRAGQGQKVAAALKRLQVKS